MLLVKTRYKVKRYTALRNLRAAPADAEAQQEDAAQGGGRQHGRQIADATERRGARPPPGKGLWSAGQRQQTAETQPATREPRPDPSRERAGAGRWASWRRAEALGLATQN